MQLTRGSGLLMHITSLPSDFGIGDFGPQAIKFIDQLVLSKQKYWQILPLTPIDSTFGNSPYASASAFAINPLLVSPELLLEEGLVTETDLHGHKTSSTGRVDYDKTRQLKSQLYKTAFQNWKNTTAFRKFKSAHKYWLDDYALFTAIKNENDGTPWIEWPAGLRDRQKEALQDKREQLAKEIHFVEFQQFILHEQWHRVKSYANEHGIQIIGDLPIYVEYGSSDVWCHTDLFKLDQDKKPNVVAGVPPDYFSKTGQLWGNPIYDWKKLKTRKFSWWSKRLAHNLDMYDIVRIDHFRGLVAFWQVPADEKTAINGEWIDVPTDDFISQLKKACPNFNVIAEDLGLITDDVHDAMRRYQLPGMKVLHFAFNSDTDSNAYLPHNYEENCLVYTGTHDNNTTVGWYTCDATDIDRWNMGVYMDHGTDEHYVHWHLIELALASVANAAIFPVQDILGLDETARMNIPGTLEGNWQWQLQPEQLTHEVLERLATLTEQTNRN